MDPWIKTLPTARMVYPSELFNRLKYWFWRVYTPIHPFVRNASCAIGIGRLIRYGTMPEVKNNGRQNFLLGKVSPEHSAQELAKFLVSKGFGNNFIAWRDTDEFISLRKTVDFKQQYHIRIFKDGEVRGHFEFTPEYHPILHMIRVGFEDRPDDFNELLRGWIVPVEN